MPVCVQGHGPVRAQTFRNGVRDGWRHLTLSLSCPLTSSHPAPWQPHHRRLGEPQKHFGRSGTHWCPTQPGPDSQPQESFRPLVNHISSRTQSASVAPVLIQP